MKANSSDHPPSKLPITNHAYKRCVVKSSEAAPGVIMYRRGGSGFGPPSAHVKQPLSGNVGAHGGASPSSGHLAAAA